MHKPTASLLTVTAACLTLTLAPMVQATPNILGFYPSTDIYAKGNLHLDVDTFGRGLTGDAMITSGLSYGTGPDHDGLFGRSEVGFDYVLSMMDAKPMASSRQRVLLNAKTQLYNNPASGVRLVTGVWSLGNRAVGGADVGYVLASKAFQRGRLHLGVAHAFSSPAMMRAMDDSMGKMDRTYLQLGADTMITPRLQLAADFYSGKSPLSAFQPTLNYMINDRAGIMLGYVRFNDKSIMPSRHQLYAAFDYNFGRGSSMNMKQTMRMPASNMSPMPIDSNTMTSSSMTSRPR
jgi:hypothetical protein